MDNPIIGTTKLNGEEYAVYKYPKRSVYYPFVSGLCRHCGAILKKSIKGKDYCSNICWEKPDETTLEYILFYKPDVDIEGLNKSTAKQLLAKIKR